MIKDCFKHKKDFDRVLLMHPIALMILFDMMNFCNNHNMEFLITSTISTEMEDEEINRKTDTHRTGRAFDISLRTWPEKFTNKFKLHFDAKYGVFGATNKKGYTRLIVDHVGTARHLHVQIHSRYSEEIRVANVK